MDFPIIIVVFGLLSIGVLFLLARKVLRLVVRLALVGVILLFLIGGGLAWWWYGTDNPASKRNDNRPANTRRGTSR